MLAIRSTRPASRVQDNRAHGRDRDLGLLIALALLAHRSSRNAARSAQCRSNLKQIGMALDPLQRRVPGVRTGTPCPGWTAARLPHPAATGCAVGRQGHPVDRPDVTQLDQPCLDNHFNFELGTEGSASSLGYLGFFANTTVFATKISLLHCPSDRVESFRFQPSFAGGYLRSHDHQGELCRELGEHGYGSVQSVRSPLCASSHIAVRPFERDCLHGHRRHEQHGILRRDPPGRPQRYPRGGLDERAGSRFVHEPAHPQRSIGLRSPGSSGAERKRMTPTVCVSEPGMPARVGRTGGKPTPDCAASMRAGSTCSWETGR